jgi:hypothetical protein
MAAFAQCVQDNNGVTVPERPARGEGGPPQNGTTPSGAPAARGGSVSAEAAPGQAPPGVDADTWAAAQKACADVAPTPPGAGDASTGSAT